ncbi:MAG: LppX_LprAFG lipoprotein [Chloroflexota bacterium]|nr:LppX_LprAFG lipoprotein [Chloroflexota bacterium]
MVGIGFLRFTGAATTVVAGLLALAACGGDSGTPAKSNADLFKAAAANMKAATSYHLEADIKQGDQNMSMKGDIDMANKNTQLDMSAAGQSVKVIKVGGTVYNSVDNGATYVKGDASSDPSSNFAGLWDNFKPDEIDKSKDALKDGTPATEKIDGVDTKHITANAKDLSSLSAGSSKAMDGTIDLWVTTDANPTIRQLKIDGTSDGKPIAATLKWNKINEKFDIKAPPTSTAPHVRYL